MPFPYKHVVMIGATAGIGLALANRLAEVGVKVTAVGRRRDRLDDFVRRHGEDKAQAAQFDITVKDKIQDFADDLMAKYPDIDCIFLNAGFQRGENFTKPEQVDLKAFHEQINVNFMCPVDLAHAFLPHLMKKGTQTSIIFTTSAISVIPAVTMPAYSASKAALAYFVMCLRGQLQKSSVKIIEVSPPAVQTELHDYLGEGGRAFGMPIDAFTDEAYRRLASGNEDCILIGSVGPEETYKKAVDTRYEGFDEVSKIYLPRLLGQ